MITLTQKNEPLKKDELEKMLWRVKKGDLDARNIVAERCLKFVVHIANRYSKSDIDADDLFSIGAIGLVKGIETYDVEKYGVKPFSTYIGRTIENEILMQFRRDKNKIKPISFEDCVNDICVNNGKDVIKMQDVLPSKEIDTVEAIIRGEEVEALHKAINKLPEREQYIIRKFYGIGKTEELDYNYYFADYFGTNNPTLVQREIAEKINTSRSYISRLLAEAIKKLRKELSNNTEEKNINYNNLKK